MTRNSLKTWLLATTLAAAGNALADDAYECIDEEGRRVFTSTPCGDLQAGNMPPMETIKEQMYKIDRVDRQMADIKRQIRDQKLEMRAALDEVYSRGYATEELRDAKAAEIKESFTRRIKALSHELALLGDARNQLVRHSANIFLDERQASRP